jgi:N-methylhydantoinase A
MTGANGRPRVGIDVGGTFTDVALSDADGALEVHKVPSTPADHSRGVLDGFDATAKVVDPAHLGAVAHATTVATNAILERRGARTGLVTTYGFRDVLELGRMRLSQLYDLNYEKVPPLVRRSHRRVIRERMLATGAPLTTPDPQEILRELEHLVAEGTEALAVALINSHANPAHERLVARIAANSFPGLPVCLSSDLVPEAGEYERTSTAVVNAYLIPVVSRYLEAIEAGLRTRGIGGDVLVMQSSGGLMSLSRAVERPCHLVESGPAAGVLAARALLRSTLDVSGAAGAIVFDMGGTTAKASVVEGGEIRVTSSYEVGGRLSEWGGFMGGGGYPLKLPVIDIAEVGAGGGSLIRVDSGGAVHVGPESAGADPGPACYGRNTAATVTDANVVLGYLNPDHLLGGRLKLDAGAARRAIDAHVARPLGAASYEAAWAAHVVANSSMLPAVKAVTSQRGRDPRDFVLLAFGGSGPVHAAGLASLLEVSRVIVPPHPGVFSALGLLAARQEHSTVRSLYGRFGELQPRELERLFDEQRRDLLADLGAASNDGVETQRFLDLRYVGQGTELTIALPHGRISGSSLARTRAHFDDEHHRTYRHRSDVELEVVAMRMTASGAEHAWARRRPRDDKRPAARRRVYFGPAGWLETAVVSRNEVKRHPARGPLIVEEYDATTVVPPNAVVHVDSDGNLVVDLLPGADLPGGG